MFNDKLLITRQTQYAKHVDNSEFYRFVIDDIYERLDHLDKKCDKILYIGNDADSNLHWNDKKKIIFCPNHLNVLNYQQQFDLIIFPFMLHFVSDIQKFLKQIYHLLDDHGIFISNFAGENSLKNLRNLFIKIESETKATHSPHVIPFIQLASVPELLKHTGFAENITDMEALELEYDSPLDLMRAIKHIGQNNILLKQANYAITKKMYKLLQTKYSQQFTDKIHLITFITSKTKGTIKIKQKPND